MNLFRKPKPVALPDAMTVPSPKPFLQQERADIETRVLLLQRERDDLNEQADDAQRRADRCRAEARDREATIAIHERSLADIRAVEAANLERAEAEVETACADAVAVAEPEIDCGLGGLSAPSATPPAELDGVRMALARYPKARRNRPAAPVLQAAE